jgi:hypothetical protein
VNGGIRTPSQCGLAVERCLKEQLGTTVLLWCIANEMH